MAIILKEGKTFKDRFSSTGSSSCYGVIDECRGSKLHKNQVFKLDIYKNKAARDAGMAPVESFTYGCNGDKYDEYFSIEALADSSENEYKKAYQYVLVEVMEPDIQEEEQTAVWADWKSDE